MHKKVASVVFLYLVLARRSKCISYVIHRNGQHCIPKYKASKTGVVNELSVDISRRESPPYDK